MHLYLSWKPVLYMVMLGILHIVPFASDVECQDLQGQSGGFLSIASTPDSAEAYLDGAFVGRTPLSRISLPAGKRVLTLIRGGLVTIRDTILVVSSEPLTRSYSFSLAASLSIDTDPADAGLYVNDVFRGRTPAMLRDLLPGRTKVMVSRYGYRNITDTVDLAAGGTATRKFALELLPVQLRVEGTPGDAQLFINGKETSSGPMLDTLVAAGPLQVYAAMKTGGQSAELSLRADPMTWINLQVQMNTFSMDPFLHSLLLPGWGQSRAGAGSLGRGISIAFGASLLFTGVAMINYGNVNKEYDDILTRYSVSTNRGELANLHGQVQTAYDKARSAYKLQVAGVITMLAIYFLSAADALLIHNRFSSIEELGSGPLPLGQEIPGSSGPGSRLTMRLPL